MVVHQVPSNTRFLSTAPLLQGDCRARFPGASGHDVYVSSPIQTIFLFLFTDASFNRCFIPLELTANHIESVPDGSVCDTCVFSVGHITASLHLGSLGRFQIRGGPFKQRNHHEKAQKWENVPLNRPQKGHLFVLKQEGAVLWPGGASAGDVRSCSGVTLKKLQYRSGDSEQF